MTARAIPTALIPVEALRRQAEAILLAYGATPEEATIQADARLQGELRGHPGQGQGLRGIARYCAMLEIGGIIPGAAFEVVFETPAMALVDGHKGFGQVIASRAMDLAIEKARVVGVGLVAVRHSNHLGITAYHAIRAANQRMIGLCLTNAGPEMAPWGGITPTLGTNPWGIAAPTDLGFPLALDMALSTSGKGMVRWHQREGKSIPTDWAYDRHGNLTDDPAEAMDGPLVPIGAFKGTGLALMTDVLCGVLSGAAFGLSPYRDPTNHDVGHMLIAIDVERFMPWEEYLARVRQLCDEVRASERKAGVTEILLPGELEHRRSVERTRDGVAFDLEALDGLRALAEARGVAFVLDEYRKGATR
jgi:LDH2 family malate/lactate/ureidoglycolate dehydrogenase